MDLWTIATSGEDRRETLSEADKTYFTRSFSTHDSSLRINSDKDLLGESRREKSHKELSEKNVMISEPLLDKHTLQFKQLPKFLEEEDMSRQSGRRRTSTTVE